MLYPEGPKIEKIQDFAPGLKLSSEGTTSLKPGILGDSLCASGDGLRFAQNSCALFVGFPGGRLPPLLGLAFWGWASLLLGGVCICACISYVPYLICIHGILTCLGASASHLLSGLRLH